MGVVQISGAIIVMNLSLLNLSDVQASQQPSNIDFPPTQAKLKSVRNHFISRKPQVLSLDNEKWEKSVWKLG